MRYRGIKELFAMQAELDKRIATNHADIKPNGDSVVPEWKFLALYVELGECANEWRGFKVWSNDRKPRTVKKIETDWDDNGTPTEWLCNENENPLLEETVDCLHFVLSIGNDIDYKIPGDMYLEQLVASSHYPSTLHQFNAVIGSLSDLNLYIGGPSSEEMNGELYEPVFLNMLALTEKLEFTWDDIVKAYKDKNKVNHDRQNKGY